MYRLSVFTIVLITVLTIGACKKKKAIKACRENGWNDGLEYYNNSGEKPEPVCNGVTGDFRVADLNIPPGGQTSDFQISFILETPSVEVTVYGKDKMFADGDSYTGDGSTTGSNQDLYYDNIYMEYASQDNVGGNASFSIEKIDIANKLLTANFIFNYSSSGANYNYEMVLEEFAFCNVPSPNACN